MKMIKFVGDPNHGGHGAATINFYGEIFRKGHFTRCSDEFIIGKAERSSHFRVKDVKPRKEKSDAPDSE